VEWVIGIFTTLLRPRYRAGWMQACATPRAEVASGLAEFFVCLSLLLVRYLHFAGARFAAVSGATTAKAAEVHGETAVMTLGLIVLVEYLVHPLTIALLYFALEGFGRAIAGLVTQEIVPTLPLALLARLQSRAQAARYERSLGERIPDTVQKPGPAGFDLLISSCRPKLNWDHLITVSFDDELYEVAAEESGEPPLRFRYLLRKKPESKIVRGLYHYDPNEVLDAG